MPEVFPNHLPQTRPCRERLDHAAHPAGLAWRFRRLAQVRTILTLAVAGICFLPGVRGDTPVLVPVVAPGPPADTVVHITDAQDHLGNGHLGHTADARSRANALYAQATLLSEGTAGDLQSALGLFRQIVDLDPTFIDARVKLANLLLQTGQLDKAYEILQATADAHLTSIPVEVALGYTQRLRGQNDDALRLSKHALKADPTQAGAMRVMLEIAGDQEDLAGGVLHVEDIFKAAGDNVPASCWLNLARIYGEVARSERVPPSTDTLLKTRLPILQQAAAIPPPDIGTLSLLGDTLHKLDRNAEALRAFRMAMELDPSNVEITLDCAEIESDLGDTAAAIKDYESADDLSPGLPGMRERLCDLYLNLAASQNKHKDFKQASDTLAKAQALFPDSAKIRFFQAIQNRFLKNYDAALACLDQVRTLAVGPEAGALDVDFYIESALTLSLAGKKDRLEAVLREGVAKFPDKPEMMNELAYFWADNGSHLTEALDLSQRAAKLAPDNGPILDTWGWVYFQMGQPKDALPYLQRAALLTNNDPVVLQHVGDTYLKLGLRREAIATWTRALEKDPKNGDLITRIDAAQAQAKNAHTRSAPNP